MKTLKGVLMPFVIALFYIIIFIFACFSWQFNQKTSNKKPQNFEHLLDAIEFVESRGDVNAIGDNGKAIGCMQIHKIFVDDVNIILGKNKYTHIDRWDRNKSREMVKIYITYYAARIGKKPTYEDMARIQNGGPNGWKKDCTKSYWKKVKARLKENDYG